MKNSLKKFNFCLLFLVLLFGLVACNEKEQSIVNPIVEQGPYYVEDNTLPTISLSDNDTNGTISWDEGQDISFGEHEYSWTFVPTNTTSFKKATGSISLTFISNENSLPLNIVAESITQSSVTIYTTGNPISLKSRNFNLPNNTVFVSATCQTEIINAGNYNVSVVVNAEANYTINGEASYRFDNVSIVVTESIIENQGFGAIIGHEDAQKEDMLAISEAQIASIKEDLKIAYFHTSHGNQIIEGNYAINYLFGNNRSKDFSNAIVYDSYGANIYVDAGQKNSAIEAPGTDIGSLVTATKSFFGDAGQNGDLLFEAGKDLDVNVVIWSWCGELSVFSEERVQQYLDDITELENYYNGVNNPKKIVFVYMTGHLFNDSYYAGVNDTKETNTRNNEIIREYCKNNNKILFDFEDIESYNPDGVYFGDKCDDTSKYWTGHNNTVAEWWARDWQNGKEENVDWVSQGTLVSAVSELDFVGFKPFSLFSHVEYSILVQSKAYAFWSLLDHLTTVV